jgi:demethylmenaquinone methyltransferase / 2-methoxy-6-polyprenyl-1,4-benzoquinol methylase
VSDDKRIAEKEHAVRVREMFSGISARYDLLNHLLSGNTDRRWRRRLAQRLGNEVGSNSSILDVACGTGDLSLELFESLGARVVGTDFCRPMLDLAARKLTSAHAAIPLIEGDALCLPFRSQSFDGVTIAFGLRNLADVDAGLGELLRVLKPGGIAAVLEFSKPGLPGFSALFRFYFNRVLPVLGGVVSGSRSAYHYLPDSVSRFPDQRHLAARMRAIGFVDVEFENLTGGIAALHCGRRAPDSRNESVAGEVSNQATNKCSPHDQA